jgi:hypothetical protein
MRRILCCHCRTHLYWYQGDFTGPVRPADFLPARPSIPAPRKGRAMLCPKCQRAWYMVRVTGALVVLTDEGFRPQPPEGQRTGLARLQPSWPAELQGMGSEYRDPAEQQERL